MKSPNHLYAFSEDHPDDRTIHVRLVLPEPSRIANQPLRAAVEELRAKEADGARRESETRALEAKLARIKKLIVEDTQKELTGEKNDLDQLFALEEEAETALSKSGKIRRKVVERNLAAAGNVVRVWRRERAAWSKDLERESRDHAVKLVTLATELSRLALDFDTSLGALAAYAQYDTNPTANPELRPHAITFDLVTAQAALDTAIAKLAELKFA